MGFIIVFKANYYIVPSFTVFFSNLCSNSSFTMIVTPFVFLSPSECSILLFSLFILCISVRNEMSGTGSCLILLITLLFGI